MVKPGCGGLCIGIVKPPSMIIDVINVGGVATVIEAENDPPIGANSDAPKPARFPSTGADGSPANPYR
jgi:hypothetical protein